MPNKSSNAGHTAERTCVICREKKLQSLLHRFVILENKYVIDPLRQLPGRGYYCCPQKECVNRLEQWLKKFKKKRSRRN